LWTLESLWFARYADTAGMIANDVCPTEGTMSKGKLTPEGEVIAAYGAAMVAAFLTRLEST
jgi:hypothetical protein